MAYLTQTDIEAVIPAPALVDALDDDGDQVADLGVIESICATAGNQVDAYLQGLYSVPFTTPPAAVKEAALVFACEIIYGRRVSEEKNPWAKRGNAWRQKLVSIGSGKEPLSAGEAKAYTPGAIIEETPGVDGSMR